MNVLSIFVSTANITNIQLIRLGYFDRSRRFCRFLRDGLDWCWFGLEVELKVELFFTFRHVLVEFVLVADRFQRVKIAALAQHRFPVVFILDLLHDVLEVFYCLEFGK